MTFHQRNSSYWFYCGMQSITENIVDLQVSEAEKLSHLSVIV